MQRKERLSAANQDQYVSYHIIGICSSAFKVNKDIEHLSLYAVDLTAVE